MFVPVPSQPVVRAARPIRGGGLLVTADEDIFVDKYPNS